MTTGIVQTYTKAYGLCQRKTTILQISDAIGNYLSLPIPTYKQKP